MSNPKGNFSRRGHDFDRSTLSGPFAGAYLEGPVVATTDQSGSFYQGSNLSRGHDSHREGIRFTDAGDESLIERASLLNLSSTPRMSFMQAIDHLTGHIKDIKTLAKESLDYAQEQSNTPNVDYIAAIHLYTLNSEFYKELNTSLRECQNTEPFYPVLRLLLEGMSKLIKPFSGTLWRGVKANFQAYKEKEGKTVYWNGFSSCCRDSKEVLKHCRGSEGVRIEIKSAHGFDISQYSKFPCEQEVLLPPQTRLRIDSVLEKTCVMTQMPDVSDTVNSVLTQ